jgi:hypothetical protein
MLYKYVAQRPTGIPFSETDFHSDTVSEGSGFHARSIANSVASNMTGKLDEQFEGLQKLLSRLTGGTMAALVKNLKTLTELTEDESLTVNDLKRALLPFATSIETVQSGVAAIETDLSKLRVSNDEISDALVNFEGYIIAHAVFFKKIDLILSGASVDDAEDQGDQFADEIRSRNETEQTSVAAYAEGLNATCLEVQDAIAHRLGLEPLSSDYVADPDALPFTIENVAAFSSGTVARSERSEGSSAVVGGTYRDAFNTRRGDAHAKISQYVDKAWVALDDGLSTTTASPFVPEGNRIFSEQKESWSRFRDEVKREAGSAEGDTKQALAFLLQHVEVEIARCDEALICLSVKPATSALQQVVKHVSGFVSCESDNRVLETVREMLHKATQFLALRYGTGVADPSVLKDSLRNHLLWGDRILSAPGSSSLHCVSRTKAGTLVSFLAALEKEVGSHAGEEDSKIKHYCVIERIRSFFENDMTFRVKGAAGFGTPRK